MPDISPPRSSSAPDAPLPASMAEVRAGIDALDDELVALLARRLSFIRRASELKSAPSDARVPWRVEEVAANVRRRAAQVGFDADCAERIWRGMMEECIAFEERALVARREEDAPSSAGAA